MPRITRRAMAALIAVSTLLPGAALAADPLKEIRIDWATYNPVSMVLKQKGLLEKEFAKDGISVVWVQSAGSNKALEFLNAGSIDFGSTAGSAALVARINGNPIKSIYVFSRPEWTALRKGYGLSFRGQRQMQPDFMYAAVASGDIDVIAGYTSDGLIAKYDLVTLGDPRRAIPPYDAVVLLAPKRANDEGLRKALAPLLGKIDIATMREANLRAAGNDAASSPDAVAQWLWEKVGKK